MNVYRLKVSIMGIPSLNRVIEATGNCTFDDLHETIFHAFDRYDPHLYSFFITKSDSKNMRTIMDAPEITHPQNREDVMGFGRPKPSAARKRIGDVGLSEKEVFHYWFDFGDDWWHRIRVESIAHAEGNRKYIKIVKSVGQSPPQYPDFDDDDDWDDE